MKTRIVIFLIIAVIFTVESSDSQAQVYCGRRLAVTLAYLCDYGEEEQLFSKRSVDSIRGSESWSWLSPKSRALAVLRGKRQGVASECCEKPCRLSELLSYC